MRTSEDRIEALERRVRVLSTALFAVVLAGTSLALMGARGDVPDVIQAGRLEVVGEQGNVVVALRHSLFGGYAEFFDSEGNRLISMRADQGAGKVSTWNDRENALVRIAQSAAGSGWIGVYDGEKNDLVNIGASESGHGMVSASNAGGAELIRLGATKDGNGRVVTFEGGAAAKMWP